MSNNLSNPYYGVDEELSAKATAVLLREDLALIKGIYPYRGCVQTVINLLLKSIVDELREKDIRYFTPDNEREFIELIKRRTTARLD